ncbi:hypothetical protein Glove_492g27 [Diversispora epigaea]|uniref:Uncharacterized protein n=1 Tax=Diversispora epigaea TaxID=1348612 RepID=A0A397GM28_9GLOM|nr:hypothetical protein Glove_492g27 [Diversispora epigaea]
MENSNNTNTSENTSNSDDTSEQKEYPETNSNDCPNFAEVYNKERNEIYSLATKIKLN